MLFRSASLDSQALKRKEQCKFMVNDFLPRYLAQESKNASSSAQKPSASSHSIPEDGGATGLGESEFSDIPVYDFESGMLEGLAVEAGRGQDIVPSDDSEVEQVEPQPTYRDVLVKDLVPNSLQRGWSIEPEPEPGPSRVAKIGRAHV